MLGWLLVDAGHAAEAEPHFRAAVKDGNPDVRASAQSGLEALAKLKSN